MIKELRYYPSGEDKRIRLGQGRAFKPDQRIAYLDDCSDDIVALVSKSLEETILNLKDYAVPVVGEVVIRAVNSKAADEFLELHHNKVDGINWLRVNGPIPEKE